jgi:hypothetical protein
VLCRLLQTVERRTLARQCPTVLTLLQSFPKKMELQEPTFKDIIVLYRWGARGGGGACP